MDFSLSEEQVLLKDSVDKYIRDHCDVERHRRLSQTPLGFDADTWREFAELGWLCLPFREELGGLGGSAVDIMVMAEALGRAPVREPFLTTVVTCGGLLQCAGNPAQQDHYIAGIIAGEAQWAFAFAEQGAGYDLSMAACFATRTATGYQLSGAKHAVLNGHCADFIIVTANTAEGLGLFVVEGNAVGLQRTAFRALDGSCGANLVFDGVDVPASLLLGAPGQAGQFIEQMLLTTLVAMGAEAVGAMEVLLHTTVDYTKLREQFGQPIGRFQALQHRMADMYLKVEETRALLLNAAILVDQGSDDALRACAALKVKLAEAGRFVSQQAVQLHGGIGMTDELIVGHHFKRLMLLATLYGDENHFLDRYMALAA